MSYTLSQDELEININFYPLTFGAILASCGAHALSLYGIIVIVISNYESFSFDKSVIKSFYL